MLDDVSKRIASGRAEEVCGRLCQKEGRKLLMIYSLAELAVFVGGRGGEEIDSCVVDDCQRKVLFGDLGAHDSQSCSQRRHLN